jgi:hypothetical protein
LELLVRRLARTVERWDEERLPRDPFPYYR